MNKQEMTRPEGVPHDALPPDFDGWDKEPSVPEHPLGHIAAIDYDTGLPIVKRKSAGQASTQQPTEKPAKPEPAEDPKPKPAEKPKLQPAYSKGDSVQLPDGSTGRIAHMIANMKTARVRTNDGKNITVRHDSLKPVVEVKAHYRKAPGA